MHKTTIEKSNQIAPTSRWNAYDIKCQKIIILIITYIRPALHSKPAHLKSSHSTNTQYSIHV